MVRKFFILTVIITALLSFFVASFAYGRDDYKSKLGFDIKGLKTNQNSEIGWVAGVRTARFLGKSDVYIGLAGYYGSATGGNPSAENIYYGGVTFGWDCKFSRTVMCEVDILLGYGGGKFTNRTPALEEQSYLVAEPAFATGFALGKGWRIMGTLSYQHMSRAPNFAGFTFGLRLDRRTHTTVKASDP